MATYILFWNPAISSYTKERFLEDFKEKESVGNWSFYEHEDVSWDDIYYMVRCGEGKTGIVMRGPITSSCYEGEDWSPKKRPHVYYADIETSVCINPWSEAPLLTPEFLTERFPDFDWFGGHSGRRLDDESAKRLDDIWFEYIDSNPGIFSKREGYIDEYNDMMMPPRLRQRFMELHNDRCDVCGYSYKELFGPSTAEEDDLTIEPYAVISPILKRLIFNVCDNCRWVSEDALAEKLKDTADLGQ